MGKKRNLANKHIEKLIDELVDYEEAYVSRSCCPYRFNLFGAELIDRPSNCAQIDCESCKEDFYLQVNNNLRKRFTVDKKSGDKGMTKAELMKLVGKKVTIYFKDGERGIYGTLNYVDEFSAKHDYRKPNYFYIGNTSFKVSHIRKIESEE